MYPNVCVCLSTPDNQEEATTRVFTYMTTKKKKECPCRRIIAVYKQPLIVEVMREKRWMDTCFLSLLGEMSSLRNAIRGELVRA